MRQAGDIFLNGKQVGLYENGVTAYGIDITDALRFDGKENVLAVKVDNTTSYKERAFCVANPKNPDGSPCDPVGYEWNASDFNPDHGGINRRVWLHVTGKIYQTLPLYYGLESQGVYVHAANFDISKNTADVTVDAEVHNASGDRATVGLSVAIGIMKATCAPSSTRSCGYGGRGEERSVGDGQPEGGALLEPEDPYLYDVYTILKWMEGGRREPPRDGISQGRIQRRRGHRRCVYQRQVRLPQGILRTLGRRMGSGGRGLSGLDARLHGEADSRVPWQLHALDAYLAAEGRRGFLRALRHRPGVSCGRQRARGHGAPVGSESRGDARLDDLLPQQPEHPVLGGRNTIVTPEEMQQMVDLRKQWDPDGGRLMGYRDNDTVAANEALTPIAEFYEVMIGQAPQADLVTKPGQYFRGYSVERRDRAPIVEAEDLRDEGARRYWDDYSPPYYGFKKGPNDTYQHTSESFALQAVKRYWEYWRTVFPTPIRSTRDGRAIARFTSPMKMRTGGRTRAKFRGSAARWMRCGCPSRFISPIA